MNISEKGTIRDTEIKEIFKNTNFGDKSSRQVLIDATLDKLAGWHIGYTAKQCAIEERFDKIGKRMSTPNSEDLVIEFENRCNDPFQLSYDKFNKEWDIHALGKVLHSFELLEDAEACVEILKKSV
jgi:hypothetical protein